MTETELAVLKHSFSDLSDDVKALQASVTDIRDILQRELLGLDTRVVRIETKLVNVERLLPELELIGRMHFALKVISLIGSLLLASILTLLFALLTGQAHIVFK